MNASSAARGSLHSIRRRARVIAPELVGRLEAALDRFRPRVGEGFGALNGQERRQEVVREVFAKVPFGLVVETGTFRGTTAEFLWQESQVPVCTIELDPRYYRYSVHRFRNQPAITVLRGDSREVVRRLAADGQSANKTTFVYLDAHWTDALPLWEEIRTVSSAWRDWLILVDDFQVPHDPGYGFDDYGNGQRLCVDLLPTEHLTGAVIFWPSAHSSTETGKRRGWAILASRGLMADALREIQGLRQGKLPGSAGFG